MCVFFDNKYILSYSIGRMAHTSHKKQDRTKSGGVRRKKPQMKGEEDSPIMVHERPRHKTPERLV